MNRTIAKIIHDNIWGEISVSEKAIQVIDSSEFQRLHFISQTSVAYKVFPTAKTSRFEHSLGVYHVTSLLLKHLFDTQPELREMIPFDPELIKIAELVHDIGHGAFSHSFDRAMNDSHERRSKQITSQVLTRLGWDSHDIDIVCQMIDPGNSVWYMTLIKNKSHSLKLLRISLQYFKTTLLFFNRW